MSPRDEPIVRIQDASVSYGQIEALTNITLTVEKGTIFGLAGSDGAGKSTLLRMIAGMVEPSSGRVIINELDGVRERLKIKPLIGYMPQRFGFYNYMTVLENLNFFLDIFGVFGAEREKRKERYLGFSNLLPFQDRLAGNLSGGMKQKLGLACVLAHQPELLILDEPTNGVDPVSRREFWDILFEMKKNGMTIMISTAYLEEGERCDKLALMHKSRLLEVSEPGTIKANYNTLEEAMIHRIKDVDEELADEQFGI
jgi:ABC-2 type transport system ATP-binding protein